MEKLGRISKAALLALTLTVAALMANTQLVQAQATTPTPSEWIKLITTTPDGAYRHMQGITNHPWVCSPSCNPERTGYTDGPGPSSGHVLWRANVPLHNWGFGVVANGTVYTLSMDQNTLFALDAYTGEEIWHYSLPITEEMPARYSIFGPWRNDNWIHIVKNQVLAGYGNDNKTIMVGAPTGTLEWLSPEGRVALVCPPGTVFDRGYAVYLTFWETQRTICYELLYDEQIKMTKRWDSTNVSDRLSYFEGKVYGVVHNSKWASCVDARTGNLIWNYTTPDPEREFYQHAVISDGKVYLPMSYTNKVVVLDAETGTFLWDLVIEDADYFNYVAVSHDKLYISGGTECRIYCVSASNGTLLWKFDTAGPTEYYYPIIAQDKVYVASAAAPFTGFPMPGTYPGYVYCLDAMTGELIWEYLTPQAVVNSWIADGNLYASTPFGYLWCWGKGPTEMTVATTSQSVASGQSIVIYGRLQDISPFSQQNPELQSPWVASVPVVLSYVDLATGTWTDFATVTTSSDGTFIYGWTPSSEGAYAIVARFEGNDAYYWSSAKTTIQVSPASPQSATAEQVQSAVDAMQPIVTALVALVVIAIVIGVVNLAIMFRKMRK
jgi:outer membrane protein assembly factor BamB